MSDRRNDAELELLKYGLSPPHLRYAMDQVPLEFGGRNQSHNDVGAGECFIRGSKHDMSKRQASIIVTVRAVPPQTVKPILVFKAVPKMTMRDDGLVEIDCRRASRLKESYDPRVDVLFQENAWADCDIMDCWGELFQKQTRPDSDENPKFFRIVGLDNLNSQSTADFQMTLKSWGVKLVYTPEDCTDLCAVVDDEIGDFLKSVMNRLYREHRDASEENNDAWADGDINASKRRELMATWLGEAWDELCATDIIEKAFKRMGLCNDINGKENHLVKVRKLKTYKPPALEDPPMKQLTTQQMKEFKKREDAVRKEERLNKRKATLEKRKRTAKRRRRE